MPQRNLGLVGGRRGAREVEDISGSVDLEALAKEVLARRLAMEDRGEVSELMAELETLSEDEALALLEQAE